jgi:pimeloyl-ACP methyl ester carboxylesterase
VWAAPRSPKRDGPVASTTLLTAAEGRRSAKMGELAYSNFEIRNSKSTRVILSLEGTVKYTAKIVLLALSLACGGTSEQPPPFFDDSLQLTEGPGTVTAADGVEIAYTISGHGPPALVFIHGWMGDQSFWKAQVEEFSTTNTVVTIDLPGHGLSGTGRDHWSMASYGSDVTTVVEHLGLEDVVLIGHSMGGPVILEAARLMPERVVSAVAIDTLQDADFEYEPQEVEGFIAELEADFAGTCGGFVASMFVDGTDPAFIERITSDMCDGERDIGAALIREFVDYDRGDALAAIDVPVTGINSDMWPTNVEVNRKYRPEFDAIVMKGAGHFLMMEKPEEFNRHLAQVIAGYR